MPQKMKKVQKSSLVIREIFGLLFYYVIVVSNKTLHYFTLLLYQI